MSAHLLLYSGRNGSAETLEKCDCLQDCNSLAYEALVVDSRIRYNDFTSKGILKFYFGSDEYTTYKRIPSYGTVKFLSDVGGLLELFLGVSVLSLIEIVYFLLFRLSSDLIKHLKLRNQIEPERRVRHGAWRMD